MSSSKVSAAKKHRLQKKSLSTSVIPYSPAPVAELDLTQKGPLTTDDLTTELQPTKQKVDPAEVVNFDDLPKGLKDICFTDCKFSKEYCQQNAKLIKRISLWLYPELFPKKDKDGKDVKKPDLFPKKEEKDKDKKEEKDKDKEKDKAKPSDERKTDDKDKRTEDKKTDEKTEAKDEARATEEAARRFLSKRTVSSCSLDRLNHARKIVRPPETSIKKKYEKSLALGSGGFGSVILAKEKLATPIPDPKKSGKKLKKRNVAIKIVPHNTVKQHQSNFSEIGFLSTLSHPNILTFYDAYLITTVDKKKKLTTEEVWIVTEYLEGGTFENAAGKMTDGNLKYLSHQILLALVYLHENGLVHRDLKSPNVMISTTAQVKLIDFGLCRELDTRGKKIEMCGSPCFVPPEMILGQPHGFPADIYSLGVCLLELLLGAPPHHRQPLKCMMLAATTGHMDIVPSSASKDCVSFLQGCLVLDQDQRQTAAQLLQHAWLKDLDVEQARKEMYPILVRLFVEEFNLG